MGWRPEERSSSDVGQWTTLLRGLLGHFAISTTSVECYGLSHACFYLRLSSNVTTRVWIDNLYHIKPGKYHGVGTLRYDYLCSQEYVQQMLSILIRYRPYIYTIILLKSVAVHKLQVTLLARLSREISNCSYRLTALPLTSSRLSSA